MKTRAGGRGFVLGILGIVAGAGVTGALQPAGQPDPFAVPLREFDLHSYRTAETEQAGRAATDALAQRYGGGWHVYSWNPQTGTPSAIYGSGAVVAPALLSESDVEATARRELAVNAGVLGVDPANLRLTGTPRGMGKWAAHFQQTYHGIDVWGGRASLTFTEGGRLFVMGAEYYSGITVDPAPRYGARQAEGVAQAELPFQAATDRIEEGTQLYVLPVPLSETAVEPHLAWRVKVRTADPLGVWVTWVDAHDGHILWRYNQISFANFLGTDRGVIEPGTYCDGQEEQPLAHARVTVSGVGTAYSDENGEWTLSYSGSDPRTVTADLYGPYVNVNNMAGPDAVFTGTATPGTPLAVFFDDWVAQPDERDAFDAINDIHDFFMLFAPEFGYVHGQIPCNVSLPQTCNAHWDGYSINFYSEGDGCANTGRIQDVVAHEYGHGIQHAILGYQGTQGLGEGNSDVMGNLVTRDPRVARGFYLGDCYNGVRNSDNNLRYPEDVVGQGEHAAGRVIAGFHWDLMQGLWTVYGEDQGTVESARLWHYARALELPDTQPEQVFATFVVDDDDGNLENGTPHYPFICEAAQNHHFDCPVVLSGVIIQHTPLMSTTQEGDRELAATIFSTVGPLAPDSLWVHCRVDGGAFQPLPLTPTGALDQYRAVIPGLSQPCTVEYYLRAVDEAGNVGVHPADAPTVLHTFDVAYIYDGMEQDDGWALNLEGTDDATAGFWIRADPVGTRAQPEDDHTPGAGVACWVTENGDPDDLPGQHDVDRGTTSLYTVAYDLSRADSARVVYWRWYSNNQGAPPFDDRWVVRARNDGGEWVDVENTTSQPNRWARIVVDLNALFGSELGLVQLKFLASDTGSLSMVEAAVDDFEVLLWDASTDVPEPSGGPARFALHGSRVNPAVGRADIRLQVPVATVAQLEVFDVAGRRVRRLAREVFAPGVHTVSWDGRDASGQPAAAGVYYCRMQCAGFTAVRAIVLSR
jgi:hypothetical protein